MLNQDIISEYLKNRDSLNANFNQASLFAPVLSKSPPGGFVPQPYEPQFASAYPMAQKLLASPSLSGFDPGSFESNDPGTFGGTFSPGQSPSGGDGGVPTVPGFTPSGRGMPSWAGPVASIMGGAASLATGNPFGALGIWSGANGLQGQTGSQHSASGGNPYGYVPATGNPGPGYSQTDINGNPISPPTVSVDGGWGANIGLPGYSGSTVDFGLDAPSISAPSVSPGGWGGGNDDGAY